MEKNMKIYEELQARGLLAQLTDPDEIRDLVNDGNRKDTKGGSGHINPWLSDGGASGLNTGETFDSPILGLSAALLGLWTRTGPLVRQQQPPQF